MLIFNTLNYPIRQFGRFLFGNLDVFHSETWTYIIRKFGHISFGNLDDFCSAIWPYFHFKTNSTGQWSDPYISL